MIYDDYNEDFVTRLVVHLVNSKLPYSLEKYSGVHLKLGDITVSGLSVHRDNVCIIRFDKRTASESAFKKWVRRKYPSDDIAHDDGFPRTDSLDKMHKYLDKIRAAEYHKRLDELYARWVLVKDNV